MFRRRPSFCRGLRQSGGRAGGFAFPGLDAQGRALGHIQPVPGKNLARAGNAQPALELVLHAFGHARYGVARGVYPALDAVYKAGSNIFAHVQKLTGQSLDIGHAALELRLDRVPARFKRRAYAAFREDGGRQFPALLHEPRPQPLQPVPAGGKRGLHLVPILINQVGSQADARHQQAHGIEQQRPPQHGNGPAGQRKAFYQRAGKHTPQLQGAVSQHGRTLAAQRKALDQRAAGEAPRAKQQRTEPADSAARLAHAARKKRGRARRHAEQAKQRLHGADSPGQHGAEGQELYRRRYQRPAQQGEAKAHGKQPAPEQKQTGGQLRHRRHGFLILFYPRRPALEQRQKGFPHGKRRRKKRLAQRFRRKVELHAQLFGLFHRRRHALVEVFSENVLLACFQGFGLNLFIVVHLHDERP